jgi:hypothetical protein
MLSMVWQFVVLPGAHTVTVVNRVLASGLVLVGPLLTTTLTTLAPVGAELPEEPVDPDDGPSPPPQESIGRHRTAHSARRQEPDGAIVRMNLTISVNLRC